MEGVIGDVGVNVEVEDLELEVMGVEVEVTVSGPWWSAQCLRAHAALCASVRIFLFGLVRMHRLVHRRLSGGALHAHDACLSIRFSFLRAGLGVVGVVRVAVAMAALDAMGVLVGWFRRLGGGKATSYLLPLMRRHLLRHLRLRCRRLLRHNRIHLRMRVLSFRHHDSCFHVELNASLVVCVESS